MGRVDQDSIKLAEDKRELWIKFCNFAVRFSVCIVLAFCFEFE